MNFCIYFCFTEIHLKEDIKNFIKFYEFQERMLQGGPDTFWMF